MKQRIKEKEEKRKNPEPECLWVIERTVNVETLGLESEFRVF